MLTTRNHGVWRKKVWYEIKGSTPNNFFILIFSCNLLNSHDITTNSIKKTNIYIYINTIANLLKQPCDWNQSEIIAHSWRPFPLRLTLLDQTGSYLSLLQFVINTRIMWRIISFCSKRSRSYVFLFWYWPELTKAILTW